jgi:predicted DNA-binding transcriptional regulator AlpA
MGEHCDRATLATLVTNPDRVAGLPLGALPSLIGEVEALRARLLAQLMVAAAAVPGPPPRDGAGIPDRLLTAAQAADRLNVDVRWIYQKAKSLPFTRRLSPGTLRFSEKGLERWKESRR